VPKEDILKQKLEKEESKQRETPFLTKQVGKKVATMTSC